MAVKDADERYSEVVRLRAQVDPLYDPTYFTLDLHGCAARFKQQYQSFTRIFRLQFHQDRRRLRSLLRAGQTRTLVQLEADLYAAVKLVDGQTWQRDHRVEHVQLLGAAFDGERTNWERVRGMLTWAEGFHALLAGEAPTPEVIRLVTGPAKGLVTLRARRDQLAELWSRWEAEATYLDGLALVELLLAGIATLGDADPALLESALASWQQGLQTFWDAAAALEEHQTAHARAAVADDLQYWERLREDATLAREVAAFEAWLAPREDDFARDLGTDFHGAQTDWDALLAALEWADTFVLEYPGTVVPEALAHTAARELPPADLTAIWTALERARSSLEESEQELVFTETVLPLDALLAAEGALATTPIAYMRGRVEWHIEQLPCLKKWLDCRERLDRCKALGLGELLEVCIDGGKFPREILAIFEKRFYLLWLDRVYAHSPVLRHFSGQAHEKVIGRFRGLDEGHQRLARQRLRALLGAQRALAFSTGGASNDSALDEATSRLKRETAKKTHRSIRYMVNQIFPALLALKPCWMMSPLSVSQFVAESAPIFDVVIFDEASQVCPEDAICAILRGKQLIVVGDSKQLPPTRFFAKTLADIEGDEDEEGAEERMEEGRTESILDECRAAAFDERSLLWHYRSQHESLIAFSNLHFYGDRLITFPNPAASHAAGVRWEFVADGVYQRSSARTNPREAARVAQIIFEYAQSGGDLKKLGVVALSQAQQEAIRHTIEELLRRIPEHSAWKDELSEEDASGFFVKNLESVQGDERDTIILSIGYARDMHGNMYTNFGPVNRRGGERRLNVAVTRAKRQMIVVASMHASDLPAQLTNPGARALRDYLDYAEHGPTALQNQVVGGVNNPGQSPESLLESPFEQAVYDALMAKGLVLVPQVGCSSYRIDFAVRDPRNHDAYLLGIECDGATYHSSATARDRDRLRQKHLEGLGWTIHRIWSTDWRANPVREVERVMAKVAETQAASQERPQVPTRVVVTSADQGSSANREPASAAPDGFQRDQPVKTITIPAQPAISPVTSPAPMSASNRCTHAALAARHAAGTGARMCENCHYYRARTSTKFTCDRDMTYKRRAADGHTPACPGWHQR